MGGGGAGTARRPPGHHPPCGSELLSRGCNHPEHPSHQPLFALVLQVLLALSGRVAVFGEALGIGFARERSPAQAGLPQ